MRYTIKTSGLMCGHCDATVETALLNVAGVTTPTPITRPRPSRWSAPTP